jgi:hypothetical protein
MVWMGAGAVLGLALAAVQLIPFAVYLTRSPVWHDRDHERPGVLEISPPRILDVACTAFPYLYGSQRRGHPNLAKPLGVHNVNESAGGFVGLAPLLVLAPLAWRKRGGDSRTWFFATLVFVGGALAFDVPPFVNLTRLIPLLNVIDNRRLTLWVAFGLCMLAALGIDRLDHGDLRLSKRMRISGLCTAAAFLVLAIGLACARPMLRAKARAHYLSISAAHSDGTREKLMASEFAERQANHAARGLPVYYAYCTVQLLALLGLRAYASRPRAATRFLVAGLFTLTLGDLFVFGYELNPATQIADDRPESPILAFLRENARPPFRVVGVGAELPPNSLMRYGLADCRNYDSVELSSNLEWFETLYESDPKRLARTSRREVSWSGVERAREQLRFALVKYAVSSTQPTESLLRSAQKIGDVWVVNLEPEKPVFMQPSAAEIRIDASAVPGDVVVVPVTFDPGWRAEVDGVAVEVKAYRGAFLSIAGVNRAREYVFHYDPIEARIGLGISGLAVVLVTGLFLAGCIATGCSKKRSWGLEARVGGR